VNRSLVISHWLLDEVGMEKALQLLNLPLEGTHHRGVDDAWNIAGILSELVLKRRISGSFGIIMLMFTMNIL